MVVLAFTGIGGILGIILFQFLTYIKEFLVVMFDSKTHPSICFFMD